MLPVLILVTIAIVAWAHWLVRSRRAPRWARAIAPVVALATIACGVYCLWSLHRGFDAVGEASPEQRQRLLSSSIADAYTTLAIGWAIAALGVAVATIVTLWRR